MTRQRPVPATSSAAVEDLRAAVPFPGVLGRVCTATCETGCRQSATDTGLSIRNIERHVADHDRESETPWLPPVRGGHGAPRGGRGRRARPGSRRPTSSGSPGTRSRCTSGRIESGGGCGTPSTKRSCRPTCSTPSWASSSAWVRRSACGRGAGPRRARRGVRRGCRRCGDPGRCHAAGRTCSRPGTRCARPTIPRAPWRRGSGWPPPSTASWRAPASRLRPRPFSSVMGKLSETEMAELAKVAASPPAALGGEPRALSFEAIAGECARCLHCDCRAASTCLLERYAEEYGASPTRFRRKRQALHAESRPSARDLRTRQVHRLRDLRDGHDGDGRGAGSDLHRPGVRRAGGRTVRRTAAGRLAPGGGAGRDLVPDGGVGVSIETLIARSPSQEARACAWRPSPDTGAGYDPRRAWARRFFVCLASVEARRAGPRSRES